jgi:hypothetical protein
MFKDSKTYFTGFDKLNKELKYVFQESINKI